MRSYRTVLSDMERENIYHYMILTGENAGEKMICAEGKNAKCREDLKPFFEQAEKEAASSAIPGIMEVGGERVYVEYLSSKPYLILCGGGHVSMELAKLSDFMDYPYTVIDDRIEFVSEERFEHAQQRICGEFEKVLKEQKFMKNPYYVIVTRGHAGDLACLKQILKLPSAYMGMIGSRGKVEKTMQTLSGEGYAKDDLNKVYAPVGLPIGGETPKEIALSIMAQIVKVRNGGKKTVEFDAEVERELKKTDDEKIMVTIVSKKGSAPRGCGSRMVVGKGGVAAGTVGGGKVEAQVTKEALEMLGTECTHALKTYQLNEQDAASLGMWCGGELEVFYEREGN